MDPKKTLDDPQGELENPSKLYGMSVYVVLLGEGS